MSSMCFLISVIFFDDWGRVGVLFLSCSHFVLSTCISKGFRSAAFVGSVSLKMSAYSAQSARRPFCRFASPPKVISSRNEAAGAVDFVVTNGANVSVLSLSISSTARTTLEGFHVMGERSSLAACCVSAARTTGFCCPLIACAMARSLSACLFRFLSATDFLGRLTALGTQLAKQCDP